jgi:hypothetical protein
MCLRMNWYREARSKDLSWTTWESSARRSRCRIGSCAAQAGQLEELGIRAQRKQAFEVEVADGRRIERDIGYALVRAGGTEAPDLVVFAEAGDMTLLGAHSLGGLNLRIDPIRKELLPAGPVVTGVA